MAGLTIRGDALEARSALAFMPRSTGEAGGVAPVASRLVGPGAHVAHGLAISDGFLTHSLPRHLPTCLLIEPRELVREKPAEQLFHLRQVETAFSACGIRRIEGFEVGLTIVYDLIRDRRGADQLGSRTS